MRKALREEKHDRGGYQVTSREPSPVVLGGLILGPIALRRPGRGNPRALRAFFEKRRAIWNQPK